MATDHSAQPGSMRAEVARPAQGAGYSPQFAHDYYAYESQWEEEEYGTGVAASRLERLKPNDQQLTQILGWFSIGVGLAALLAPRAFGRAIGVGDRPALLRTVGVRELASGIGLLSERAPGAWAWSRVGGDAMDLALLGAASSQREGDPRRIAIAAAGVLGMTALDTYSAQRLTASQSAEAPQLVVTETITINAPPEVIYRFWKNLENLPLFMHHLEAVSATSESTSHWVARAPASTSVEWDAEIVDDQPDRRVGWRTLPGSEVTHEGMVTFEPAPGGRGTIVRVDMLYCPPAGKVGAQIARLFGEEPRQQIDDDLRRLKQLLETGEIATTIGQPSGRRSLLGRATLGRRVQ